MSDSGEHQRVRRRRKRRRRAETDEMIVPWPDQGEERSGGASPWILWGVAALGALLLLAIMEAMGLR